MAFIRGLSTRASLVKRRYSPSFSYILHDDRENRAREDTSVQDIKSNLSQWRSFGSSLNSFAAHGLTHPRRCLDLALSPSIGAAFFRNMSTTVGGGSDKIELMSDVLIDPSVTAAAVQTPAVNEVSVAAADSFLPVAALQHVIDAIHSFTGFNWWASIVLTTLVIRGVTLPFVINQLKATSKLTLLRPHLEQIKQEMQDKGMEPDAVADGQKRMKALFNEYGVSVFTPVKGLLIQGPVFISFFLAISNMVEKVPSFKNGGAYWFVDLTTPDSMYILPALTALTFWITVECNMQEGMEGNPAGKTMKNISRVLAVATVPLTSGFPKAIFCYWITSNIFSFTYGLALKVPGVKKALGIPEIPVNPSKAAPESPFNMLSALKKATARQASGASSSIESSSLSKVADQRKSSSSSVSQRLTSLEKQVKAKKKNKKR